MIRVKEKTKRTLEREMVRTGEGTTRPWLVRGLEQVASKVLEIQILNPRVSQPTSKKSKE